MPFRVGRGCSIRQGFRGPLRALALGGDHAVSATRAVAVAHLAKLRRSGAAGSSTSAGLSEARPGPLGAEPGRGVRPRGRCGRTEVAQLAAPSTCAPRGTQTRARRREAAGEWAWARGEPPVEKRDQAARLGVWGAERGPAQPHAPGPRAILERAGNRSAVGTSAFLRGIPA